MHSERDNSAASKAFRALEYELSGEAGEKLRKKIQASLDVKNDVLRTAKENSKDIQYLVNRNNPMQFITLSDGIMVEHTLSLEEKRGRDRRGFGFLGERQGNWKKTKRGQNSIRSRKKRKRERSLSRLRKRSRWGWISEIKNSSLHSRLKIRNYERECKVSVF